MNALDVAAPDPALQNALAGAAADVGAEQGGRDPAQRVDLGEARKRQPDRLERGDVGVAEAARAQRGPADRVHLAVGERQRLDQIVGDAFGAQLLDDLVVVRAVRGLDPATDRLGGLEDDPDRTLPIGIALEHVVGGLADLDALAAAPEEAPPHDVGMERGDEHGDPVQRQTTGEEPVAQPGEHVLRLARRGRALDQPVDHRLNAVGLQMLRP